MVILSPSLRSPAKPLPSKKPYSIPRVLRQFLFKGGHSTGFDVEDDKQSITYKKYVGGEIFSISGISSGLGELKAIGYSAATDKALTGIASYSISTASGSTVATFTKNETTYALNLYESAIDTSGGTSCSVEHQW